MSFSSPNKFTIEQQIARAQLQSGDKALEKQARDDISAFPSLGTIYGLQNKKFTSDEIKEVEAYIAEQKAKYPDSLKDLFDLWEKMVKGKRDILLSTQKQSQNLSQVVNSSKPNSPTTVPTTSTIPAEIHTTPNAPVPTSSLETKDKYDLKVYAGYALQELGKSGKTIQNLQTALVWKLDIPLEINGKFDQATLDAVKAFQQSVPNITHGVDGLVGPVTIGKLFDAPVSGDAPVAPLPQPQAVPETVEVSPTIVQLTQAMEQFRKTYQAVNDKTNKILPDHEKDIESRNKAIQQAAGPVIKILQTLDPSKLSEAERKTYESMKLEVAKYFSNELPGVKSRQYTDYSSAFSLAEGIIAPILKESKITLPPAPTQADIEKRMKSINPSLHARYAEALGKGWTPGQFLSNPKIRAEWADVQSKISGEYEDAVQKKLAELMGNNAVLKTPEQYEALVLMTTIMGSSNFLDFKKRNIDNWIQTGGAIGSGIGGAIAGVGIIGFTSWTGVGAVAGASVIGASIATAGAALSRGRYDEKYLLTEGGINLATFGIAGKIGMVAKAKYIDQGSKIAGYSLDGVTGLALGVSGEYTRALTDGANFKDLPHGKMILMQLPWALLPMTMGGLANLKGRAQNIDKAVQTIRSQANIGDNVGAAHTAQAIAPEVEAVANAARTQAQANHAVTPPNTTATSAHTPSGVPTTEVQAIPGQPANTSRISARVEPDTYAATNISAFTTREITTTDVRRVKNLIKNNHYPQFIAEDGNIWSIRSVTGRSGNEMVEIGPLGAPSIAHKITIQEFVEGVNSNVRKFKEVPTRNNEIGNLNESGIHNAPTTGATSSPESVPHTSSSETVPHATTPEAPRVAATPRPQMNEQQFTEWFTALIPKVDKKKFPVGSTIKSEGIEITAGDGGKYSVKHGGTVYNYDSHADLTANIGKIIKTPSERLALLKSTESNSIISHMKGYTGTEVPGVPGLRWKHDGHGKMSFERKNPENGSWTPTEIAALTADEQLAAVAHWYKVNPSQIREGVKKAEGASLHDAVGHAEKEGFIKRNGLAAWNKVEEGFKSAKEKSISGSKLIFVDGPKGIAQAITGIGKSTVTLPGAIAWGVGFEAIDLIVEPEERELSLSNAGELIFRIAALRYMGIIRGTGAIALQNWITGAYLQSPGAHVPAPTTK